MSNTCAESFKPLMEMPLIRILAPEFFLQIMLFYMFKVRIQKLSSKKCIWIQNVLVLVWPSFVVAFSLLHK